jgi:hypothetical protein
MTVFSPPPIRVSSSRSMTNGVDKQHRPLRVCQQQTDRKQSIDLRLGTADQTVLDNVPCVVCKNGYCMDTMAISRIGKQMGE